MSTDTMTAEEQELAAAMLADLHAHGYADIDQHARITVGARIRHRGHQWSEAYSEGTGVVLRLTRSPRMVQGGPDIELIALWDKPHLTSSRLSQLANYHVDVIGAQNAEYADMYAARDDAYGRERLAELTAETARAESLRPGRAAS